MLPLYIVVYGNSWEDIMYFTSLDAAKTKMIVQSMSPLDGFKPVMYEYNYDVYGVYCRSKRYWSVCPKALEEMGNIKNPQLALQLVEEHSC